MFVWSLSLYNIRNRGVFLLCKITNLLIYSYNTYKGKKNKITYQIKNGWSGNLVACDKNDSTLYGAVTADMSSEPFKSRKVLVVWLGLSNIRERRVFVERWELFAFLYRCVWWSWDLRSSIYPIVWKMQNKWSGQGKACFNCETDKFICLTGNFT